jgi:hypothetical protein
MADKELRAEARAGELGQERGRAEQLRARLRAGALTCNALRMAARLDPAAEAALGEEPPLDFGDWPQEAQLRLALAVSWAAFPGYEEENRLFQRSTLLRELLESLDAHVVGGVSRDELLERLLAAQADWVATSYDIARLPEEFAWLQTVRCAAWALRGHEPFIRSDAAWRSQDEWGLGQGFCLDPAEHLLFLSRALEEPDPAPRLAEELVPWLLGSADPLRDRVEARQRAAGDCD